MARITSLDMPSAVQYLSDSDPEMQVLGAAYIQHECYNDSDAKVAVRNHTTIFTFLTLSWVGLQADLACGCLRICF